MSLPEFTAGDVMDSSAALLNDTAKSIYTYAKQLPYLNLALQELQEFFELNDVPVNDQTSAVIELNANVSSVGFSSSNPHLPDDLIEIQKLWERTHGINPYTSMTKVNILPRYMEGIEINQLLTYVWETQQIKFLPANIAIDLKIDYLRSLFTTITSSSTIISVLNSKTFLEYRTGGLCASFIGENPNRATELNNFASLGMDRTIGISAKGRQSIVTRRRPFRSGYKRQSYI